jgi:hypothetical protein
MKVTSAIKKAEKATGVKAEKVGQFYYFTVGSQELSFAVNGREDENSNITCIKTNRVGQKDDAMTDYFCGTYHDNLTKALKFIGISQGA